MLKSCFLTTSRFVLPCLVKLYPIVPNAMIQYIIHCYTLLSIGPTLHNFYVSLFVGQANLNEYSSTWSLQRARNRGTYFLYEPSLFLIWKVSTFLNIWHDTTSSLINLPHPLLLLGFIISYWVNDIDCEIFPTVKKACSLSIFTKPISFIG